ncbi:hypothetical protein O181_106049 [Austropuccinia psidii MF-1]|uniref:Uncharacterized protein n=1 Tax=Austropuccinia psidii MF-1 TaxID=1389203 RepID=A0A9Q3JRC2_9BASI|nr:hypothetical protein [Austropuccinia psidii MF-1]
MFWWYLGYTIGLWYFGCHVCALVLSHRLTNHKLLTQRPGELEHASKCSCNQNCTVDDIANTLQDIRKRTNIGEFSLYRSSSFKEKQALRAEFKDKPRKRVAEVAKKNNTCHNCGSTDHYKSPRSGIPNRGF